MAAKEEPETNSTNSKQQHLHSDVVLPISRIRTIMKSSPDVENIAQDALYAVTFATEMFIKDLVNKIHDSDQADKSIEYNDLAELINSDEQFAFLEEIIPKKVKGKDILTSRTNSESASS